MSPLEWGTVCHMLVHFITNSMHINFSKSATVLQLFACSDSDFCMSIQGHMCTLYHGWWSLDYLSYPGHTLRQYLVRMRNIDADFNACAHHTWLFNFFLQCDAHPPLIVQRINWLSVPTSWAVVILCILYAKKDKIVSGAPRGIGSDAGRPGVWPALIIRHRLTI